MIKTLVIIEDDKYLSDLYREIFEIASPFHIEIIMDGQEAIDRLESLKPDAIMLDLHLPHVSGLDILDYIRANSLLKNIPVIVASADQASLQQAEDKALQVFKKPVSLENINTMIELFLSSA